jgi:hypothetical protein
MVGFLFAEDILKEPFKKGEAIYLNGKGGNGESYFSGPYKVSFIVESPNIVTLEEKSPYRRPFQTHAESTIKIKENHINLSTLQPLGFIYPS